MVVTPWGVGVTPAKLSVEAFKVVLASEKNLVVSLYVEYEYKTDTQQGFHKKLKSK